MAEKKEFILGLDLGTNSIGWALLEKKDGQPSDITASGVRIFQETTDAKTKIPKNRARREKRSARRLLFRRKMRRDRVLHLLVKNRLLPADEKERLDILTDNKNDPYELRKKALDERLLPFELGRVFYHLSKRRGFLSNRKAEKKAEKKDEEGKIKDAISLIRRNIKEASCRTLGEYLASEPKKRGFHTERLMYQQEFEAIWQAQHSHHPEILAQALKVALHNGIFHQRPLKLQKNLVGKCTFEPQRKRASRALLEYQRFRMLQDLNHLEIKNPKTRGYRPLEPKEREKLYSLLEKQKTMGWGKARKILKLHEGEVFNLEEGEKKGLMGNQTACAMRSILNSTWDNMPEEKKNELIVDLLTIKNEQGFLNRMKTHWGFDDATAENLAKTKLASGYARLSLKAIKKILPHLEDGLIYSKACEKAGYNHSDTTALGNSDILPEPPYLRNPVVQKALTEARRLINSIIRKYGTPSGIRIELARDMKLTKRQKEELGKTQRAREKENDKARGILQNEFNIQNPARDDIQKYNMWKECKEICPYTGTSISREMLFSHEVDVEHILPYSRTLDDSYMNKTLCMAMENRNMKHNRTPYEAYCADRKRYEEILLRVRVNKFPWPKRRRFEQKEIDTEKFVERQLNDTRYICKEVRKYLQQIGANAQVTKGEATAALRHRWNLDRILSADGSGEKNRKDHRHHAVDAIVIALTSRGLFQMLSRLSAQSGVALSQRGFNLPNPWPSFYNDACRSIEGIVVSHAPTRKITGALHEETAYGFAGKDEKGTRFFAFKKRLSDLKPNMIDQIRDKAVRELVKKRLDECGGDTKKAFGSLDANPLLHKDGKTPVNSVRLLDKRLPKTEMLEVKNESGPYKYYDLGSNHHVEIIEHVKTGKREGRFVTTIEAAKRARIEKTPIVRRDHGPDFRFIMSLCANDILEIIDENGVAEYYRVQKMSGPNNSIVLRQHTVTATQDTDRSGILHCSPNTMPRNAKKVVIDPIGRVYQCND
jgi:CRISPR-associated endonuclease Csn1